LEGIDEVSQLTKEQREKHSTSVREEGLSQIKAHEEQEKSAEIDLEIEAPGAANKVAEEGASVIQSEEEFHRLEKQLEEARKKPENKLGRKGALINLKNPKDFENSMRVVVFNDPKLNEKTIKNERFDTKDPEQTKTASMAMAMTL